MTSFAPSLSTRASRAASRLLAVVLTAALVVSSPWVDAPKAKALASETVDYAVTFNGSTQTATAADSGTAYDGINGFTMSAWVKPAAACATGFCMIANKESSWELGISAGVLDFAIMGASQNWDWQSIRAGSATLPRIPTGMWTHVVMAVDRTGNDLYFFVNGRLAYSLIDSTTYIPTTGRDSTDVLTIGGRPSAASFAGSIDEFRLYNTARITEALAQADMGTWGPANTANLAAYYDFNEGTGTSVVNKSSASGASTSATLNNSPTWGDIKTVDTTSARGETIVTFPRTYLTEVGGYTLPAGPTRARVLVVGGGGGGGSDNAGGGGAGGVYDTAFSATPTVAISAGVYAVTVGQGGYGARDMTVAPTESPATDGWATTAFGVSAGYGGAGGSGHATVARNYGNAGGSGTAGGSGGGSANEIYAGAGGAAGAGTAFNGFAGGAGGSSDSIGAGGGGASAAGAAAGTGTGGAGKSSSISGTATTYGGGGGAGRYNTQAGTAAGGTGGGGAGTLTQGGDGSANTGGGGGGATWYSTVSRGGFGGTGLVIIRWTLPQAFATTQYALSTDATSTAIAQITDTTGSPFDNLDDFTFEAWLKPTARNTYARTLLGKEASFLVALWPSDAGNQVCFAIYVANWQWQCTSSVVPSGSWTHLAFVRTGGYIVVYLNGAYSTTTAPAGANTAGTIYSNNNPVGIGGRPAAPTDNYAGLMDEVRMWNYARSATDISTFYQRRIAGNILYMPFDDVDMSYTAARNDGTRYVVNRAASAGPGFNAVLGTNATLGTSSIASVDSNLVGSGFQGYLPGVDLNNNGTAVTFAVSTQPTKGTVTVNRTTGFFNYVANGNVFGSDSFTYSVTGTNGTTTGTYNITLNDYAIASSKSFSQSSDITATVGSATSLGYSNPSTQYTNGETVRAVLSSTSGTLAATLNGSTLAAGSQNSTSLTLDGTQAQINAALNSATITSSTTNPARVTLTISMKPVDQTVGGRGWVYNSNGHFYSKYDAGAVNLTQPQATTAANAITLGGRRAYLATIQHSGENATVQTAIGSVTAYLGGNDAAVEGTFRWYGNDTNAVFRTAGAAYRNRYNNWNTGEPNDSGGNEDWVEMNGSNGIWNDCGSACIGTRQYAAIEVDPVSTRTVTNIDFSKALTATASAARNLGLGATFLSTSLWGTTETVFATISVDSGTVSLTQGGTTVSAGALGSSTFTVEATRDTLNTALNTATVTPSASGSSSVSVTYGVKRQTTGSYYYSSATDHFYFRSSTSSAQATHATTAGTTAFGGTYGYLATVTSGEEYNTVRLASSAQAWSGGSDSVSEAQWTWDAPDAYQIFSDFDQSIGGSYQQWDPAGEPNNSGQGLVITYNTSNSLWDDQGDTTAMAAVYEWAPIDTSLTLSVTSSGALSIATPSSGLTANVGTAYSVSTGASGGLTPYTYSISGALPSGLSLNTSTGVISGTTTVAGGSYAVTVTATDANNATATTTSFSIKAAAAVCSPTSTVVGTQTVLQFSSTGYCDWTVPSGVTSVDAFVVGAGGGGGSDGGVGGGGGSATRLDGIASTPGSTMTLQVGSGGTGGIYGGAAAAAGGQSSLLTTGGTTYTVNGGSAGPNSPSTTGGAGGTSTAGFAGGAGGTSATIDGTGGGNGKTGTVNYFTGSGVEYGGGGGGGIYNGGTYTIAARTGASGGGNGCAANGGTNTAGSAGVRGGGGGGGCAGNAGRTTGGAGGNGIVVIRYATDPANAFPASIGTPAYRYVGDNYQNLDTTRSKWVDSSGNSRHSPNIAGTPTMTTVTGNGSASTVRTVSGTNADSIQFASFTPTVANTYTLFQVTRYSGANKQRIIQSNDTSVNWLSGFWSGSAGVAWHTMWNTSSTNSGTTMTNWQLMTDQGTAFRQFGANRWTTNGGSFTNLGINWNYTYRTEYSDFNAAEIILYDGALSAAQIRQVENYLARTYGLLGTDYSGTNTGANGVGTLAVSKVGTVSTGNTDRLSATWTLPADTTGITDFTVEYKLTSDSSWTTWTHTASASLTSATITGLTAGSSYDVRVTPVDSGATNRPAFTASNSPWQSSTVTLGTLPASPRAGTAYNITATVTSGATGTVNFKNGGTSITGCSGAVISSGTATCSWTPSASGNATITADYSGDTAYLASSTVSSSSVTVSNAICTTSNSTTGRFQVMRITTAGVCDLSALPSGVESVDILVVGGGGGAGTNVGSGGSGGGGYYATNVAATNSSSLVATVGAGGTGGQPAADGSIVSALLDGGNGGNSTLAVGATTFTGTGGTGGQTYWTDNRCNGTTTRNSTAITGVSGSGTGGTALTSGAGGQGSSSSGVAPTAGGNGYTNSITGTSTYYGGGGGGGGWGIAGGAGGLGGGGSGNQTWSGQTPGNPGTDNLGGGGGSGVSCGAGGSGGSGIVIVRYAQVPTISTQPAAAAKTAAQGLTLSVSATATGASASDLSYQWRKNGSNISGATSSSLVFNSITVADAGTYSVVVKSTGTGGSAVSSVTSADAVVTVAQASQTITFNALADKTYGDAAFTVSATAQSGGTVTFASTTTGVCTVSGTTVTIVNVGTCTVTASQAGTADYTAATDVSRSFTVLQKALTVSGTTASGKTYDRTTTATPNFGSSTLVGRVGSDDVTLVTAAGTASFADKTVGTGKTVTVAGLTLGGTTASRYTLTQPTTTASITSAALTVSGITASNKVYDGLASATSQLNTGSVALVGVIGADVVTLSTGSATGTFADKTVGTGKTVTVAGLTLGGADSGNYSLTQPTTTADITAKTLTVSGITATDKTYDRTNTATLNTGSAAFVGKVAGDTVNIDVSSAAGTFPDKLVGSSRAVTVTGVAKSGADAGNYSITQPTTTASITAKGLTVSNVTASNRTYDGTNSATALLNLGTAALSGVITNDTVTINTASATATFASKIVGSGKQVSVAGITIGGADSGNYSLVQPTTTADITAKSLTVSGITAANKTYNASTTATLNTGSAAFVGVESGDTVTIGLGSVAGTFADKNIGSGKTVSITGVTKTGGDAGNYVITQPSTTANITVKTLTVTGITAANRTYDATTAATGLLDKSLAALSGVESGDTVTMSHTSATATFADKNIGTGKTVTVAGITISGGDSGNYTLTQPTTTANITAATLTVTGITAADKNYDGTTTASVNSSSAAFAGILGSDVVTIDTSSVTGSFSSAAFGTNKSVQIAGVGKAGTDAGNYVITQPTTTASISKYVLTVSGITAANKTYNASTAATLSTGSASLQGVQNGETVTLNTGSASGAFADKNVGTGKTVQVSGLTISGATASNYTLTQPTATANITAKTLTVSGITATNKTYNASTTATLNTGSAAFVGVESGDTVTIELGSVAGTFADKNIGTGKTVSVTGVSKSGGDAGNYVITQPTVSANITSKTLTVTGITAGNRTYDATTAATSLLGTGSAALAGVESGDTVTLSTSSVSATFVDKNIGTGKTVNIAGLTISGGDSGNYTLTQPTTTADITAKTLTVTGITAANKTYNASTTATVNTGSAAFVGIESGDTVTIGLGSIAGTFADKNVGSGKTVSITGVTKTGGDAGNYVITQPSTTASITAKTLTVTGITATDRTYDATDSATALLDKSLAALVGVVAGDDVSMSHASATATFADKTVGSTKTVTIAGITKSGTDAGNYVITQPTTTAAITAKTLTVSGITAANKTYNASTTATLNTGSAAFVGVESGDTVTIGLGSVAGTFADKNVGSGKTVSITGVSKTGGDAGNYVITQPTTTAAITAKTLTVSGITAANKTYNASTTATLNTGSAAFVGVESGDTVTIGLGSVAGTFADKNVGSGKTVSITGVAKTGGDAGNYVITQPSTTANISAKSLTVTGITAANRTYDATTAATGLLDKSLAALSGVESGDTVTMSHTSATATFADKNIGTGKTVTVAGITISGGDSGNYTLTQPTTTADITAKTLTVSGITAANKTYNASTTATLNTGSAAFVGVESGDTVTIGLGSVAGTFADKNVGSGKTVSITGVAKTGGDAGNYVITQPSTTADITAKTLTVSGITAANKTYNASTTATLNTGSAAFVGVESGDTVTIGLGSVAGTFADKNVGSGKTVSITGVAKTGGDAGNYVITQPSTTANITAKTLTVSGITSANKTYDATISATSLLNHVSAALVGVESGDTVTLVTSQIAAVFLNKNVGSAKSVVISGLTISGSDSGNYSVTQPTTTADITTATLTVSGITASTRIYDGTTSATLNLSGAALVGADAGDTVTLVTSSASGAFSSAAVGTGKTVQVAGLTITGADAGNYALTQPTTTADILTASAGLSWGTPAGITYGTNLGASQLNATANVAGTFTYSPVAGTKLGVGSHTLSVSFTPTNAAYDPDSTTVTITVTAKALTVSGVVAANKTYDATTSATLDTGSAAFVGVVAGDDVTIGLGSVAGTFADKNIGTGKTVSITGVNKTGGDAGNYVITQPSTTANITAKTLTVSGITAANKTYNASTTATLNTGSAAFVGVESGDSVTIGLGSVAGTFADKNVGSGKTVSITGVNKTGGDAGNYVITQPSTTANITAKTLTVSGITAANKTYNASTTATLNTGSAAFVGVESGDTVTIGLGSVAGTFADKNVGSGKTVSITGVAKTGGDAGNYVITQPSTTANITAKTLTVSGITAADRIYDASDSATALLDKSLAALVGVVAGDDVSMNHASATATFADKTVGSNKTVTIAGITKSGTDAGNYSLTQPSTTASITEKTLTVSGITASNKTYDALTAASLNTGSAAFVGVESGDTVTIGLGSVAGTFADKNVGSGKTVSITGINKTGGDAGNYVITQPSTTANITAKTLTVTGITAANKTYNASVTAALNTGAAAFIGIVNGDDMTIGLGSVAGTFADKNIGSNKTVSITGVSKTGGDAGNYVITQPSTTANITAKTLTVTGITAADRIYDATDSATALLDKSLATLVGVVAGDDVSMSHGSATATFADKTVGSNKTVNITGITKSGADAGNYTLTQPTTTASITTKTLTVTGITAGNKTYDALTSATLNTGSAAFVGVESGDTVTIGLGSVAGTFADKNIGSNKTVNITGVTKTGGDAGNYTLTQPTTTASITAKTLTVSGITAANRVYDATVSATAMLDKTSATLVGIVVGDDVSMSHASATATFADKTVGSNKTVNIIGITKSGADAGNYTLTQPTTTASITAKTLTVSGITANNKTYNASTTASLNTGLAAFIGVESGDTVSIGLGSVAGTFADKNIGSGKTVSITGVTKTGGDAGNYSITQPSTTANITAKTLTVTGITANNKVFTGTVAATVIAGSAAFAGVESGDSVTIGTGSVAAVFDDANVGTNKTVTVTGVSKSGTDAGNYVITQPFSTANITQATSGLSWSTPSSIEFGTSLGSTQLGATASVAGTAVYNRASGERLDAGTHVLSVTFTPDSGNYATESASVSLVVTQRPLTVTADSVTVTYGGSVTQSFATSGLSSPDTALSVTYRYAGTGGTTYASSTSVPVNAGSYSITPSALSLSSGLLANYSVTYSNGSLQVNRATQQSLVAVATATTLTYAAPTKATTTLSTTGGDGDGSVSYAVVGGSNAVCSISGTTLTVEGAGACQVTATKAQGTNHLSATSAPIGVTVNKAPQTVTLDAIADRTYGDGTFSATTSASSGLTVGLQAGPAGVCDIPSGHTVRILANGTCTVTASQPGNGNYLSATAAPSSSLTRSFIIARKTLTLSGVSADNRTYDGTRQATPLISGSLASASLVGVVSGDTVSLDTSATDATFATKTIGAAKAITVAGVALAGTHADRYVLTQPTGLTANVTARTVTVSGITVPTRAYDTSTTASLDVTGHSLSGLVAGDVAHLDASAYAATFATAGVATGKNVTVTGLSLAGTDAGNYVLAQPVLQGTVVKASATVNYNATRVTTYNGTPRALSATSTPSSLVVTHSYSGNTPTVYGPTSAPPTNAGGYTVAGTIVDANYEGSATANWLINKQTVTVSIDPSALSRTFDGTARPVSASSSPSGRNIVVDYSGSGGTSYGSSWAPTNAGNYTVTATVEEANFDGVATAGLAIARAVQPTLALSNPTSMQYGTPMNLVATGGAGSGAVVFSRVSGTCTVDGATGRVTATSTGTCSVRADRAESTNYLAATSSTQTVTIAKATQAIAFGTEIPSMPLPDTNYVPSAASTSGLPVTINVTAGAGSSCTISDGTVRFLASGVCVIIAGQAGDANHEAAPSVSQTIEVGRLNQTIDFPQPSVRTFGSSPTVLAGSASSGLPLSFTVVSGASSCSVSADGTLTVGAVGSCTVSAAQPGDSSFAAAATVTRTLSVVPTRATQPFIASVSAGDAMITVGYTAPANNGGSAVVAYSLWASSPSASKVSRSDCSTGTMSCVLSGLVNGASYTVSVAAVTAAGMGEQSEAVEVLVPNPTLDAPLAVVGARSSTTIDLTWDDPAAFDASTFQRYDVYLREEGGSYGSPVVVTSVNGLTTNSRALSVMTREPSDIDSPARAQSVTTRSARFTGLNPARKYQAKIVTITTVRSVEALTNTSSALVMPFSVPDTVRELAVDAPTATTALVTWRVPASSGGTPITEYVVSSNRGACALASLTTTRCTVTGLSAGDSLTVSVRARNSVGDGAVTSVTYAVPTIPGAPTVSAVSAAQTTASVTWSAPPANGGRSVTSYTATAVNASDQADAVRCSSFSTRCELRGMKPGTTYGVRVRAFNSVGGGSWSATFTFDTSKTITTDWQSFRNQNQTAKSTAQLVTALPPAPAKVSKTSVSGGSRTKVVATRRLIDASIPVTHAIISVSTTSGKLLARIKVRVDSDNPETSVTVPYASKKVKVAVQFANEYGISSGGPVGVNIAEGNTFDSTVVADQVRVVGTEVAPYTYFARGSSTLSPAAKSELKKVAASVRQRGGLVYVSGFAARNELRSTWLVQGLARMRAETVAKYLSTLGVRQWITFAGASAPTSPWDESRVRRAVVSTDTVINQA